MNKFFTKMAFLWVVVSSMVLLPTASFAIDLFNTETGILIIPEVDVNGDTFYDNVTLKLDFATGKFEFISAEIKPETISATPLDTLEDQNIKMDFMGCTRSGRNEVTCHVELTSLGGFDREVRVWVANSAYQQEPTKLFDDLGNTYIASEVVAGNLQGTNNIDINFIAGIPTLAKYKFSNISPNASSLSLFQPEFDVLDTGVHFSGDFRNINF